METADELRRLRELAQRRARLEGAFQQAHFEFERCLEGLREAGASDEQIDRVLKRPQPRLVRAPDVPRQAQPPRIDGRAEGFWNDD